MALAVVVLLVLSAAEALMASIEPEELESMGVVRQAQEPAEAREAVEILFPGPVSRI